MRYKIISLLTIFSILGLLACGVTVRNQAMGEKKENNLNGRLIAATNQFGFDLFNQLQLKDQGKNIFCSPLSVALALAMTYNGAAGDTKEAMQRTLNIREMDHNELNQSSAALINALKSSDSKVELTIANSLWARQEVKFNQAFLDRNRQFFGAEIASLNFADPNAKTTINDWVSRNTKGKIPTIIDKINPQDVMFLINAIYFKGLWEKKFEKTLTKDEPFYLPSGAQKQVPMMSQSGSYLYYQGDKVQVLRLFYGSKSTGIDLVLPEKGSSINELLKGLSHNRYEQWTGGLRRTPGDIKIPRFKLDYESSLNDPLATLGMGVAFTAGKADFSGMREQKDLYISEVKHKAIVEVNEEGTEAAAATSVGISTTSAVRTPQRFTFIADRPFLMMIRDQRTNAILFMGVVTEPK